MFEDIENKFFFIYIVRDTARISPYELLVGSISTQLFPIQILLCQPNSVSNIKPRLSAQVASGETSCDTTFQLKYIRMAACEEKQRAAQRSTQYILYSPLYTLHFTFDSFIFYTPHFTLDTLQPTSFLHTTICTM